MKDKNNFIECADQILESLLAKIKKEFSKKKEALNVKGGGRIRDHYVEAQVLLFLDTNQALKEYLKKKFNVDILIPEVAWWFDFAIQSKDIFIPIRIKADDLLSNHTYDLNCELGLYYSLTGLNPSFKVQKSWKTFFRDLNRDLQECETDYYFLVIAKNDLQMSFYTSLKRMHSLVTSGEHLPYQCVFSLNQQRVERNYQQAKKFLLDALKDSVKKAANIQAQYEEAFDSPRKQLDTNELNIDG